eukprot:6896706-Pyramimonas_sp.AAC.1
MGSVPPRPEIRVKFGSSGWLWGGLVGGQYGRQLDGGFSQLSASGGPRRASGPSRADSGLNTGPWEW